jgi:hypothetical protein
VFRLSPFTGRSQALATFGNGQADLVWENTVTGERGIWILNKGVLSSIISLPTVPTYWHIAGAGDFLGNGQADLVWENTVTGERGIWILNKGVLSSIINLPTVATEWRIAGTADFLGTGQADLVWENTVTGQRSIWIMKNGAPTSTIDLGIVPTVWQISGASSPVAAVAYPLKTSSVGRYLVDQNNVPFMIVGDSPQSLIVNLSEADAAAYFADRMAAGFNSVWINLLCNTYTGGNPNGTTFDGIAPFTTAGDLSTPNPAYFQRVDDMINLAERYGLTVFLDPIETGGWLATLENNGPTKDFNYGVYLGNRYKNFPNIVWLHGNDFQTWGTASNDAVVRAVANGI